MINRFVNEYVFLSNFYPVEVAFEGVFYPSVEHAYQAAKTLDMKVREVISFIPSAGQAKRAGRKVKIRPGWDGMKVGVMKELVQKKFQDPELKTRLLNTGDRIIIEGNDWGDTFWGMCDNQGRNELGQILMSIRSELRS